MSLRPNVNCTAHRTLLALSRNAAGKVRLVTTNFDRLFEAAAPKTPVWTPRRLPDFKDGHGFEGIVHLHGIFDPSYTKATDGPFVLSSAEFGRAYLAEGWATAFFRSAIQNYLIVFVGYTADDPPVQYLLEALNRVTDAKQNRLYAFQAGGEDAAKALWAHKGVQAIAYAPDNRHAALWQTLEAWAERARNPAGWRKRLIRRAKRGPQVLSPHERGQIVHLAVTEVGAAAIASAKPTLPASWLCVFDPSVRYGKAGHASSYVDPFADYGLDSDSPPPPQLEGYGHRPPEIPEYAINVLGPISSDLPELGGRLSGPEDWHRSALPPRLRSLAIWLHQVCDDPVSVWWASAKNGLHPSVIHLIKHALSQRTDTSALRGCLRTPSQRGLDDHGLM